MESQDEQVVGRQYAVTCFGMVIDENCSRGQAVTLLYKIKVR